LAHCKAINNAKTFNTAKIPGEIQLNPDLFFQKDLLAKCASPLPPELAEDAEALSFQQNSFNRVMHELVREVTSPNQLVREQV